MLQCIQTERLWRGDQVKYTISIFALTICTIFGAQNMAIAGTCSSKPKECKPIAKTTFFVNGQVPKSGDGTAWESAFKTIQEAVDAVIKNNNSGAPLLSHTIAVAQGTYSLSALQLPNEGLPIKALIQYEDIRADLTIMGGFVAGAKCLEERSSDPALTILEGRKDGIKAVLASFNPRSLKSKLVIDGFTVRDFGSQEISDQGGAMAVTGGYLIAKNIIFKDNMAKRGGGIFIDTSTALFEKCSFFGNQAQDGGAINIYVADPSLVQGLYIYGCTIGGVGDLSNRAENGGFIFARQEQSMLKINYTDPKYGEIPSVDNQPIAKP